MKNKQIFFFMLCVFSLNANALPLPQIAGAAFGVWNLCVLFFAFLLLTFPFLRKLKLNSLVVKGLCLLLLASVMGNVYLYSTSSNDSKVTNNIHLEDEEEFVPGMIWRDADRRKDTNSITEVGAYNLQKSGNPNYIFLDARSKSETLLGSAKGFIKMRWADLYTNYKESLKDKTVIVTCWTGMRGSSVCSQLRSLGINCKYLVNGLQGWVNSKLPLELSPGVSIERLGTASPSTNYNKYLIPEDVINHIKSGVNIVDIRYKSEFMKNRFPGAVNIPFEELTSEDVKSKINLLPAKPVIIFCYGGASCAESTTFAWELNNQGKNFLGIFAGDKESLREDLKKQGVALSEEITYWKMFIDFKKSTEIKTANVFKILKSLLPLPTWLVFCLVCIPLTILLHYSQKFLLGVQNVKLNSNSVNVWGQKDSEMALRNKVNLKGNLINSLKSTALSLVFILFYLWLMIPISSAFSEDSIFSVKDLASTGFSILSVVASLLLGNSIYTNLNKESASINLGKNLLKIKWWFCFLLVLWMLVYCSNIFLLGVSISLSYLLLISFSKKLKSHATKVLAVRDLKNGCVNLKDVVYAVSDKTKASNLSLLMSLGYPVPNGFVVTKENMKEIKKFKILNILKGEIGVRSTMSDEDGLKESFAGCYKSIMPVSNKDANLEKAIEEVFLSYGNKGNKNSLVLIQECVDAVISGTLFSKHPGWGGMMLLEWGLGLSSNRNEGTEDSYLGVYFRNGLDLAWSNEDNLFQDGKKEEIKKLLNKEVSKLLNCGLELEKIYNSSVNIEWAIDVSGKLWLLQARSDTHLMGLNIFEKEREELLEKVYKEINNGVFTSDVKILNEGELQKVAGLRTNLSLSLIKSLWVDGSSADLGARMAKYRWIGKPGGVLPYESLCGSLWLSCIPSIKEPGKLLIKQALKEFNETYEMIEGRRSKLTSYFNVNARASLLDLSINELLEIWNNTVDAWREMQVYAFYFEFMASSCSSALEKRGASFTYYENKFIFRPKNLLFVNEGSTYEMSESLFCESIDNLVDISNLSDERLTQLNLDLLKERYGEAYIENNYDGLIKMSMGKMAIDSAKNIHILLYLREKYRHESVQLYGILKKVLVQMGLNLNIGSEIFELNINEVEKFCKEMAVSPYKEDMLNDYREELNKRYWKAKELKFNALEGGEYSLNFRDIGFLGRQEKDYQKGTFEKAKGTKTCDVVLSSLKEGVNYKVIPNSSIKLNLMNKSLDDSILSGDLVSGNLVATESITGKLLILREGEGKEDLLSRLEGGEGNYIVYAKAMTPELILACMKAYKGVGDNPVKVVCVCTYYGSMLSHPAVLAREKNFPYFVKAT